MKNKYQQHQIHEQYNTVSETVRRTRPTVGNYRAISERSNRSAVHGTVAKTFRPERRARELEKGGGREVTESVRDARGEVGVSREGYRREDGATVSREVLSVKAN